MDNIVRIAFIGLAVLLAANTDVRAAQRSDEMAVGNYSVAANKALLRAERGNAQAQAILGFVYEHGRGVPQNYAAAVRWYMSAAEQGYPTAQYLLGLMYDKGLGVMKNDVLAYKWFNLAAAYAQPGAREHYQRIRDAVAAKLTTKQVAEAQWLASGFVPRR